MELASTLVNVAPNRKSKVPNLICVQLDRLVDEIKQPSEVGADELTRCQKCDSVMTRMSESHVRILNEQNRVWQCEFCDYKNVVKTDTVILDSDDADVLVRSSTESSSSNNLETSYFIFCIDLSNSMGKSTKIPNEDNGGKKSIFSLEFFENSKRRISKSESVQMAVCDCLNQLEKNAPQKRVGIVTFSKNVTVIGDGLMDKIEIENESLMDKEAIRSIANATPSFEMIQNNKEKLLKQLENLKRNKSTALGPALYYSILIASRNKGSQVLLCTDGQANRGLGALDKKSSRKEARSFYNEIIDLAVLKGVSISVVTLEGSECGLSLLGDLASKTRGYVRVVKPLKLADEFYSVIENKILATNVRLVIILPKEMYFKDYLNLVDKPYRIIKEIGNVCENTEIKFQFQVRSDVTIDVRTVKKMPVQLQLYYHSLNGNKHLRVYTLEMNLTDDEKLFEENVDRKIVGSYLISTQISLIGENCNTDEFGPLISHISSLNPTNTDKFSEEAFNEAQRSIKHVESKLNSTLRMDQASKSVADSRRKFRASANLFFPDSSSEKDDSFKMTDFDDLTATELQRLKETQSINLLKS